MKIKTTLFFSLFMSFSIIGSMAQTLNVAANGSFYLSSGTDFTSGNIINVNASGTFGIEAGVTWTTAAEFVNGKITVYGASTTTVNVGDVNQSTITITTVADDEIVCDYTKSAPSGALSSALATASYVLSDTEFWSVTKTSGSSTDVSTSGLTADAAATYGGNAAAGSTIVVRFNTVTNQWEDYSGSPGFGDFAFAADQSSLGIEDNFASNFSLYPNPLSHGEKINLNVSLRNASDIKATFFNILGKQVLEGTQIQHGVNIINTSQLQSGVYLIQFNINKGEQTFTKKLIIK